MLLPIKDFPGRFRPLHRLRLQRWAWVLFLALTAHGWSNTSDFENLPLMPESFYNGADLAGGFRSGDVFFHNDYDPTFNSWTGFAYSNQTDTTTPGFGNQYSSFSGSGADGSANYGIGFVSTPGFGIPAEADFDLPPARPQSISVTNTTYTAISMRDGDSFAKRFGGDTGDDPDYLTLTVIGQDAVGIDGGAVEIFLADYRFSDNQLDYILDDWITVDLTPLGAVHSLRFEMETTDNGMFGPNTPFYFAVDDLVWQPVPEPNSWVLLTALASVAIWLRGSLRSRAG